MSRLIWATTLTVATWLALIRLERLLWGGRPLAVAALTLLVALAFVVAITTLIDAASGATTTSSR